MLTIEGLTTLRGIGKQTHTVCLSSLSIMPGQIVAVTGESGCGKSTLLESIGLLLRPSNIHRFDLDIVTPQQSKLKIAEHLTNNNQAVLATIRATYIGFILQSGGLLPFLSVRENILLPCHMLGTMADMALFEHSIDRLKLQHLLSKKPAALSIGERQRVAFLRAITHQPRLLLADEPTASLDPHSARKLFSLFIELVKEWNIMAIVASHDWELVRTFNLPVLAANCMPGETKFEF
jgi:ABC-type antimicrobial peptide transport system, ATPase component